MKSKALPHIILAVVLALVAGVMTIRWLGSMRSTERRPKVVAKKVNVVVAAQPIAKGTRISDAMIKVKAFEESLAPTAAAHALADVIDRVTARDISKDDPITSDKLLPRGVTAAGLPALVEPGKRAVTVRGSKTLGAGGLITPGSRVDVVATFQLPGSGNTKVSKLLMEDIPVLTTGTQMETRIGKDGKEELASTDLFTLMVTPGQAETLALAADHGLLHFALRRAGDAAPSPTPGTDFQKLIGALGGAAPGGAPAVAQSGPPSPGSYVYQAVRSSVPQATGKGGASGGGAAGEAAAGKAGSSAAGEQSGAGAKALPQGSGQITIYDVSIACPMCPPR